MSGLAVARILQSVVVGQARSPAEAVAQCIAALREPGRAQPNRLDGTVADALVQVVALKETPLAELAAVTKKLSIGAIAKSTIESGINNTKHGHFLLTSGGLIQR